MQFTQARPTQTHTDPMRVVGISLITRRRRSAAGAFEFKRVRLLRHNGCVLKHADRFLATFTVVNSIELSSQTANDSAVGSDRTGRTTSSVAGTISFTRRFRDALARFPRWRCAATKLVNNSYLTLKYIPPLQKLFEQKVQIF